MQPSIATRSDCRHNLPSVDGDFWQAHYCWWNPRNCLRNIAGYWHGYFHEKQQGFSYLKKKWNIEQWKKDVNSYIDEYCEDLQGAWVSVEDGTIENGDYLMTSDRPGWLKKWDGKSRKAGKARQSINEDTKKAYIFINTY